MKAKKIFAAVLAGALALSVTACGGGETKKVESPADFEGAKVSVQTATTAHDSLQEMQAEGVNVEILPYEKVTQCFDDLELGRCDAASTQGSFSPKAMLATAPAVYGPTPGRARMSSRPEGKTPLCFSMISRAAAST